MADAPVPPRFSFDAASGRLTQRTATGVHSLFAWPAIHAFRWSGATSKSAAFQPEIAILPEQRDGDVYRFERVPSLDDHAQDAIESYCATIPPSVRRTIAQFPERQWKVLEWAARGGLLAEELLASNPALAFAVANLLDVAPTATRGRSAQTLRLILPRRKQREILDRLCFAPTERVRRIVRKVMPGSVSVAVLALLRDQLQKPAVSERLAHVPAIGSQVLALIANDTVEHVTLAALEAFARADQASADRHVATLVANAARVWGPERGAESAPLPPAPHARPVRCPEPAHVAVRKTDFPPAPFPGTDAIVPILYRQRLLDEGRAQRQDRHLSGPRAGTLHIKSQVEPGALGDRSAEVPEQSRARCRSRRGRDAVARG